LPVRVVQIVREPQPTVPPTPVNVTFDTLGLG